MVYVSQNPLDHSILALVSRQMLRDGVRQCDVCDRGIAQGEHYFSVLVERDYIPVGANVAGSGLTVDCLGNVKLDVCTSCRCNLLLSGEELVDSVP